MRICRAHKAEVVQYTIGPKYITIDQRGRHDWLIEFRIPPQDIKLFEMDLDRAICRNNSNYAQKRSGQIALDHLKIVSLPSGSFMKYLQSRGPLNAQSKIKKLSNDRLIVDTLLQLV